MKKNLLFLRLIFFGLVMLLPAIGWAETFYSQGSLAPNTLTNWNTVRLGGGTSPANFTLGDIFVIQNGHTMTTSSTWSVSGTGSKIWIENGGVLVATSAITVNSATTFQIDDGGKYIHSNATAFATTIFQGTESFSSNSTVEFTDWNTTGPNVASWGNIIFNATGAVAGSMQLSSNLTSINGTLDIIATGSTVREIRLSSTTAYNLTIAGDLNISGGALNMMSGSPSSSVNATINIGGNFNMTGGTFTAGSNTNTNAIVNFTGGSKSYTQSTGTLTNTRMSWAINSGASLALNNAFGVATGRSLTVNGTLATAATLTSSGTTTINGTFQINEGGWATGTDFVYGAAGTLVFNNSSGFYGFGGGVFWPTSNGPVNVTVQNTGGLELQTPRTVTGVFQTATGVKNTFGNDLTVSGSVIINSGGYFDNFSPTYSGSGTLIYNTGGSYGVNNEWITGSSIGYGVPQNVTIQTSGTNVSLNANKSILGTLTISNGSILTLGTHVISGDGAITVNDGGTIKVGSTSVSGAIAGNLTNTGGLTLSSGSTVEFNGSAAQTIASRTFSNLTINNASGVTMGSDASVTVGNTFTNSAGSSFVVESDASNSGSLIMANYTGSGTFTYKRYMPDAVWHMLGSPLSGQTINSGFVSGNSLTGMKHYIEGDDNWSTDYASTPPDAAFTLAKGYATKRSASGTVDLTGTPNTAAISDIALTRTNFGWNLLSNPFTSAIAANTQGDATNNLISINSSGVLDPNYTALYIWDGTAYKIINHASGSPTASLVQDYLQVGQGFFVKSKLGGGTFSITPAMQSHQTGIAFKSNPIQLASIVLNAEKNTSKISTQISYKENMNRGLDIGYDAGLMKGNPSFALYSRLVEDNGVDFGIQCLPAEYDDLVVPIGLDAKSGDIIKFTAQSFNLPEEYNVFLEDRVLGIYTNLSINDASYSIQLNSDAKGTGRFFVRTSMESALGIANLDNGNPFKVFTRPNHNQIVIHGEANTNTIVRIYSISGKQITSFSLKQSTENLVQFNEEAGVYIVKISNEQGTYTQKFGWLK